MGLCREDHICRKINGKGKIVTMNSLSQIISFIFFVFVLLNSLLGS